MLLSRVQIKNYRSIKSQTINFDPNFRILLGKNEVGKTNLLSACSLIDPETKVSPSDLRETCDGEDPVTSGSVLFIFRVSADEAKVFRSSIKAKVLADPSDVVCSFGGEDYASEDVASLFSEFLYQVDLPSGDRNFKYWSRPSLSLKPGWLVPKATLGEQLVTFGGVKRKASEVLIAFKNHIAQEDLELFETATPSRVLAKFHNILRLQLSKQLPKCLFWRYSDANLLPSSIDIESFQEDPSTCEPLRSMFLLAKENDPSAALTSAQARPNGLKNLLTRVARAATSDLQHRWKELKGVQVVLTPNGSSIDAAVKDEYNEYSFDRRSDGFKRFVSFLLLVSARSSVDEIKNIIFIQDEPDLGLHPTGVRSLLDELIKISDRNYVLVSTHSIFLVDKDRIERHYTVSKKNEETILAEADRSSINDEEVLLNALGYSLFDQIKPKNLVFEGWRDKRLFVTFLRKRSEVAAGINSQLKGDLGLVHAMGVKDIPKVLTYFDAIDRTCIVISDGDGVARTKQRELRQAKPDLVWLRYDELLGEDKELTAEDFISKQLLKSSLVRVFNAQGMEFDVPDEVFSPQDEGVVASVMRVIPGSADEKKKVCNEWKSAIFEKIEPGAVVADYERVAAGILAQI